MRAIVGPSLKAQNPSPVPAYKGQDTSNPRQRPEQVASRASPAVPSFGDNERPRDRSCTNGAGRSEQNVNDIEPDSAGESVDESIATSASDSENSSCSEDSSGRGSTATSNSKSSSGKTQHAFAGQPRRASIFADDSDPVHHPRPKEHARGATSALCPDGTSVVPSVRAWTETPDHAENDQPSDTSRGSFAYFGTATVEPPLSVRSRASGASDSEGTPPPMPSMAATPSEAAAAAERPSPVPSHESRPESRENEKERAGANGHDADAAQGDVEKREGHTVISPVSESERGPAAISTSTAEGNENKGDGSPAVEPALASANSSRPRLSAERRSLSVNTGALSRSPAPPISPSATQSHSIERTNEAFCGGAPASDRPSLGSTRLGQSLATMHEEAPSNDHQVVFQQGMLPAGSRVPLSDPRFTASTIGQFQDGQLRGSRHRSTSSAAALALHGSGSAFEASDPFPFSTMRMGPSVPSRSIWDRDASPSGSFGAVGGRYPVGSSSPQVVHPSIQRGYSFPAYQAEDSSAGAKPIGMDRSVDPGIAQRERGASISSTTSTSTSSLFGREGYLPAATPAGLRPAEATTGPYMSNSFGQASFFGGGVGDLPAPGTESRRHSIAGDLTPDISTFGGQRRAIGFEVSRTAGFGAPSTRIVPQTSMTRARAGSFAPFGSGSLAFTDDDLAGDFDFDPLQKELNRAKQEQDREQQQEQQQHELRVEEAPFRVPSGTAAAAGAHAASMPSVFGERGFGGIGSSAAGTGLDFRQRDQGRLIAGTGGAGGIDSLSASWDILTPSGQFGRSPYDHRDSLALMTKQLHQTSIGGQHNASGAATNGHSGQLNHASGTATVKGSPGTSPQQAQAQPPHRRAESKYSLSPTAKAFQIGQPESGTAADAQARQRSPSTAMQHGAFGPSLSAQSQFANAPTSGGFGSSGGGMFWITPGAAPFGPSAAVAGDAFVNPYLIPSHSLPAPPQLSDLAINGLATLGPMPPPSSGGPGGFGAFGPGSQQQTDLQDLGKGVPLSSLASGTPLYIVEFKQGRTDLFFRYRGPDSQSSRLGEELIVKGDLVIVEADRGKDLGTVVNDSITVEQVQSFLAHQSDLAMAASGARPSPDDALSSGGLGSSPTSSSSTRPTRAINPKRLFTKATPADTSLLYSKAQDEERALQLCVTKVTQRGLPMTVVAAEMQWDRRKLTFYYTASMRVDFRDLVKELFRLYKTRIWMCHLGHPSGFGMV